MNVTCTRSPAMSAKTAAGRSQKAEMAAEPRRVLQPLRSITRQATTVGLVALATLTVVPGDVVYAAGLESVPLPMPSGLTSEGRDKNKAVLVRTDRRARRSLVLVAFTRSLAIRTAHCALPIYALSRMPPSSRSKTATCCVA